MKKFLLIIFTLGIIIAPMTSFAQTSTDFEIIPKASSGGNVEKAVNAVGQT
ncbi:MAG: hypothetical protein WCP92_05185 [bacterium]